MNSGRPYSFAPKALIHAPHFARAARLAIDVPGLAYTSSG